MKAIHNKDFSVVKTFSASTIFGAFLLTEIYVYKLPNKGFKTDSFDGQYEQVLFV